MSKKWPTLLILAVTAASLFFLPAVALHTHAQLGEETAALFPESLTLSDLMFRGTAALPLAEVPALGIIHFGGAWFLAGMLLLILGCFLNIFMLEFEFETFNDLYFLPE